MDLTDTEVKLSWAGASCAPRGTFLQSNQYQKIPVCRAALEPEAADLKAELKKNLSNFIVGDSLIAVDNLVLSQFSGCLEDSWESGLQTFTSGLEEKKRRKNMFQKKNY